MSEAVENPNMNVVDENQSMTENSLNENLPQNDRVDLTENIPDENLTPNDVVRRSMRLGSTGDDDVNSYLIHNNQLTFIKFLGKGSFGEVSQSLWQKSVDVSLEVAVKKLHYVDSIQDALKEIINMQSLRHQNVVKLHGITVDPVQMIFELCDGGSLLDRLKTLEKPRLLVSQLLNYAKQLCDGMTYLELKRCVHRDLATRNVLLFNKEETIKISDFGLTRFLTKNEVYYQQKSSHGIPYRWYPPEAIWHKKFSHKSDVWSYAMTLWEMFTYGELPWDKKSIFQILSDMHANKKLRKPNYIDEEIYLIMCKCWAIAKDQRPSFADIKVLLSKKEFARGECTKSQKFDFSDKSLLPIEVDDELDIIYENASKKLFAQNNRTRQFGFVDHSSIKKLNDAEIHKEKVDSPKNTETESLSFDMKNLDLSNSAGYSRNIVKTYEKVRFEAFGLGKTSVMFQLDGIMVIFYPQLKDVEKIIQRAQSSGYPIDCCIGSPDENVIRQLNDRYPHITWVTYDKESVEKIKTNITYPQRVYLARNEKPLKLSIKSKNFKFYQNNHGYIIKGPVSKMIYVYPHEVSSDIKKLILRHKDYNIAFFCIDSLKNKNEVLEVINLVNANKNMLIFSKERSFEEKLNLVKWLHENKVKEEDLIILEKDDGYSHDYLKDIARRSFIDYFKIRKRGQSGPKSTTPDTISTATASINTLNKV